MYAVELFFLPISFDMSVELSKNMRNQRTAHACIDVVTITRLVVMLKRSIKSFSVRFFHYLLENSFGTLLAEKRLHCHGFYPKIIFKLNTVNCKLKLNCDEL